MSSHGTAVSSSQCYERVAHERRCAAAGEGRGLVRHRARRDAVGDRRHDPAVAAEAECVVVLARRAVVPVRRSARACRTDDEGADRGAIDLRVGGIVGVLRERGDDLACGPTRVADRVGLQRHALPSSLVLVGLGAGPVVDRGRGRIRGHDAVDRIVSRLEGRGRFGRPGRDRLLRRRLGARVGGLADGPRGRSLRRRWLDPLDRRRRAIGAVPRPGHSRSPS